MQARLGGSWAAHRPAELVLSSVRPKPEPARTSVRVVKPASGCDGPGGVSSDGQSEPRTARKSATTCMHAMQVLQLSLSWLLGTTVHHARAGAIWAASRAATVGQSYGRYFEPEPLPAGPLGDCLAREHSSAPSVHASRPARSTHLFHRADSRAPE